MNSITYHRYRRLQNVWEKTAKNVQDDASTLWMFRKLNKFIKYFSLPCKRKIVRHVSSSTIIVFLVKSQVYPRHQ